MLNDVPSCFTNCPVGLITIFSIPRTGSSSWSIARCFIADSLFRLAVLRTPRPTLRIEFMLLSYLSKAHQYSHVTIPCVYM